MTRPKRVTKDPISPLQRYAHKAPHGRPRDDLIVAAFDAAYDKLTETERGEIDKALGKFLALHNVGEKTAKVIVTMIAGIVAHENGI